MIPLRVARMVKPKVGSGRQAAVELGNRVFALSIIVVAAIAREMVLGTCDAKAAAKRVVYAPDALRIRCLGTVVNA